MPTSELTAAAFLVAAAAVALRYPIRANCRQVDIEDRATQPAWGVPLIAAVLAVILVASSGPEPHIIVVCLALPSLTWCAWIDLRTKRIPTMTIYASTGAVLVAGAIIDGLIEGGWAQWALSWAIGLAAAGILFALALLTGGRGIGAADVRYVLPLAALVGYHSSWSGLYALLLFSFVILLPPAVVSVIGRRTDRTTTLAYGPALLLAAVGALLLT